MKRDDGFTLLELLLAMTMMMIVFGTVASAFAVGLRSTDESTRRLDESQDGAFTANYLVKDVQSAVSLAATPCSGSAILAMGWADPVATEQVSYGFVAPTATTPGRLVRTSCGTTKDVRVVADNLRELTLTCFDESGAPLADCAGGKRVVMTLTGVQDATFAITATRRLP